LSNRYVVSQYHSLSLCLVMLAQHARLNALGKGVVLMQLSSVWMYGAQNIGSRHPGQI